MTSKNSTCGAVVLRSHSAAVAIAIRSVKAARSVSGRTPTRTYHAWPARTRPSVAGTARHSGHRSARREGRIRTRGIDDAKSMRGQHIDQAVDLLFRVVKVRRRPQPAFSQCDFNVVLLAEGKHDLLVAVHGRGKAHDPAAL